MSAGWRKIASKIAEYEKISFKTIMTFFFDKRFSEDVIKLA